MNSVNSYEEQQDDPAKREQVETTGGISALNDAEREVVTLVCYGLKDGLIAHRLGVSETAVRQQLTSITRKLGVSNRLDLVLYAYAHGLVALPR